MLSLLKNTIDKEFAANDMQVTCRVEPKAWQFDKVTNYQIKLIYKGGQHFLTVFCRAQRPFEPKVHSSLAIEPHKMARLCKIIIEAFKEVERKCNEGNEQFS